MRHTLVKYVLTLTVVALLTVAIVACGDQPTLQIKPVPSSIGGAVYIDGNGDCRPDDPELDPAGLQPPPAGAIVNLYAAGNAIPIASAVTNDRGGFLFNEVPLATDYKLALDTSTIGAHVAACNHYLSDDKASPEDTAPINVNDWELHKVSFALSP